MSINRNASAVTDKTAGFIEFDQTNTFGQIGNPTPAQEDDGIDYPNVQSAIDEMYGFVQLPHGTIYQSMSATRPNVMPSVMYSQTTTLTVSGTPTEAATVTIDGYSVSFTSSDTAETIATKIADVMAADTTNMTSATASGSVVTYTYADDQVHGVVNTTIAGVTFESVVNTLGGEVGYLGYGSWQLLGQESKFGTTIYSWLRVA